MNWLKGLLHCRIRHENPSWGIRPLSAAIVLVASILATFVLASPAMVYGGQQVGTPFLYIADSNHSETSSQILVVDPQRKVITKTYPAGFHPDIVLSPDGRRLYVVYDRLISDSQEVTRLDVINVSSDSVLATVEAPTRWQPIGDLYQSQLAISRNGRWLYMYTLKQSNTGPVTYGVAIFDTVSLKFLTDKISLPRCDTALLSASEVDTSLAVLCYGTADVRTVHIDQNGVPDTHIPDGVAIGVPKGQRPDPALLLPSKDNRQATVVMRDGAFSLVDLSNRRVLRRGSMETPAEFASQVSGGVRTTYTAGNLFLGLQPIHRYRGMVLLGLSTNDGSRGFNELILVDEETLKIKADRKVTLRFSALTVGPEIYAIDPFGSTLYILDPLSLTQLGQMEGVGKSPTIIISSGEAK